MRRVVDDEVDAGEVLERPDVAALPPDDPALHVVGGELDDGHRGLGGVARRNALQRVGDEVSRAGASTPRAPRPRACARGARARAAPALPHARGAAPVPLPASAPRPARARSSWACFVSLSSSWSWRMCSSRSARPWSRRENSSSFCSISSSFARTRSSIFSTCPRRSVSSASISLAQADGLLAGLDLRLTPHRVALAARIVEQLVADPAGLRHAGRAEDRDREQGEGGADGDPDGNSDSDQHVLGSSVGDQAATGGTFHPVPRLRGSCPRSRISGRQERAGKPLRYLARDLRVVGSEWSIIGSGFGKAAFAGKTSNGMPRHPTASHASGANDDAASSSASREKPRPASRRRSAGVTPWASSNRRSRAGSGSSAATAPAAASGATRRRLRSARIAASP